MSAAYADFLSRKSQLGGDHGIAATFLPSEMFPHQSALTAWAARKGRAAVFADSGLGKTLVELAWAENVARHTGKPVLLMTPLAVAPQVEREAARFGIDAGTSRHGEVPARVTVANYQRLHLFRPDRFAGLVCDESSILKSFDGATKAAVTEFARTLPFRLLATATAAPNDFTELGTSSEALGELGYQDMMARFFTADNGNTYGYHGKWRSGPQRAVRFKGHAEEPFWRWVASWARAMRRPSDLGFDDTGFDLPPLEYRDHVVTARAPRPGMLFDLPAVGLREEREERRRTIGERCEVAASLVAGTGEPAVVWAHLNDEADLLERLIPGAVQVSGRDSDDEKEAKLSGFAEGAMRVLVTKPQIGGWGLNWQHCAHVVTFPSHSYEQFYQSVRRCWRFGQTRPVLVETVAAEGEAAARQSLSRKSEQADRMFDALVRHMREGMAVRRSESFDEEMEVPAWLAS